MLGYHGAVPDWLKDNFGKLGRPDWPGADCLREDSDVGMRLNTMLNEFEGQP